MSEPLSMTDDEHMAWLETLSEFDAGYELARRQALKEVRRQWGDEAMRPINAVLPDPPTPPRGEREE